MTEPASGIDLTPFEISIYNDISKLADTIWSRSEEISGLTTDPKMFSIMLFKRLRSNHRGFTLLWNNNLLLEADIVLRSGIESAICIAANFKLKSDFVTAMREDAAHTLQGQIKIHRSNGDTSMVRDGEALLRELQSKLPAGSKAKKLEWKKLAKCGDVSQLYDWHKMLSGLSSHVTGFSILRGITNDAISEGQSELRKLTKKMHLMMMAGATLQGTMLHAGMIENDEGVDAAHSLISRMNEISTDWPGVK